MQHHAAQGRPMLKPRCHWSRRDETHGGHRWTDGHAFWNLEPKRAEGSVRHACANLRDDRKKLGWVAASRVVGADIRVLHDPFSAY